ncbi:hypothetical protein OG792_21250 [Micromonospora sp. NBC_01699]|uniref:hypothetical protein n=1 Tax=Micromonospora sp. NBC_01699 TaxID=2975984 RepID=UPI002E2928E5|nr:hypothetical protein [Micromonospora sp. NBC_01699]
MLIVVGGSSTGKSRSLFEAIHDVCHDWHLLLADDANAVRQATDAGLPGRTVVWLDDTPTARYLAPGGLTRTDVMALITNDRRSGPVVVVDMLWPAPYQQLTALPQTGDDPDGRAVDSWRDAREVLALALGPVVEVPEQFSGAERDRVAEAASVTGDSRLADALADTRYGVTQHLAGAPQLIKHWELGATSQAYGWALLTAAIDVRRLGVRAPITVELLTAIAPTYLSDLHAADASSTWFDTALSYATRKLHGGVRALHPIPGPTIGTVSSYEVADFLQQYGTVHRYYKVIPSDFWTVLPSFVGEPEELISLAQAAELRCLPSHAAILYRRAYPRSSTARWRLAELLASQGATEELQELTTDSTVPVARRLLAELLAEQGNEDRLRALATAGDSHAGWQLALMLNREGRMEEMRVPGLALRCDLASLLERPRKAMRESREVTAMNALAAELLSRERHETTPSDSAAGSNTAEFRKLLRGHKVESELRKMAGEGVAPARRLLAALLADQEREGDLQEMAAAGDMAARRALTDLLASQDREDELRQLAASDDHLVPRAD